MSDPNAPRRDALAPAPDGSDALPVGARLGEFEIREVIGAGGFGIVYRAWDEALERDVAIKEYMPASLAGRGAGERVTLRSRTHEENFALGLQSFVNEARLLARFDHPALVKVFRFWEGNGTAYMAMPLYRGRNLRQLRKAMAPQTPDDAWLRGLIEPLLGALEVMHGAEVVHRDIAPDNILWCDDGRPVLLDFGAARLVLTDRTQTVTAILKPQFAPLEQYAESPSLRQGPWTDLYALASTCWFMLTGRAPLPATARVLDDELEPLARLAPPGCSMQLLRALDWAMAVRPQDRPQSVAQMRDALSGRRVVPDLAERPVHAPMPAAATLDAGYEKTIQIGPAAAPARPPAPATPPHRSHRHEDLGGAERTLLLPPRSGSPLKGVLVLALVAAAAAGAWATRSQWLPLAGLQAAAPAGHAASAVAAPGAGAAEAPSASSTTAAVEGETPAAPGAPQAAGTGVVDASPAAAPPATADEPAPATAPRPRGRPASTAPAEAGPTRAPGFVLPPPVLPPADEAQVVTPAHPAIGGNAGAAASPARVPSPRALCGDQGAAKALACIRNLCDNDARFQHHPVCLRVRPQQDRAARRGANE